jgi:hypothetical protein
MQRYGKMNPATGEGVRLFGVRHLSPAGAWHVERFLEKENPDLVLIEGPSDASGLIPDMSRSNVTPPIALLCYTTELPARSIMYPLASYSPEYRAMLWAKKHGKGVRFFDLPSTVKTNLYYLEDEAETRNRIEYEQEQAEDEAKLSEKIEKWASYRRFESKIYSETARIGGEEDYESYWERNFEHNLEEGAYQNAVKVHSEELRLLTDEAQAEGQPISSAINEVREAYMKREVLSAIKEGFKPEKIVAVCGAHHVTGIISCEPMTDGEFSSLPKAEVNMTLMPYSYYKLSSFSGYGAGNRAPEYFELMWSLMQSGRLSALPVEYLSRLSAALREKHGYSSTATVIDAARLAKSLQYMHDGLLPTLGDLHESAVAVMAAGRLEAAAEAFAMLDVGTKIGSLPEGVSQTPIQDDMNRSLKRLKLERYKTVVAQNLSLDLRENRRVQSEAAAFLDLDRSVFLQRLSLLGIDFAKFLPKSQTSATWAENWILKWTPEVEMQVVESVLLGNSIEAAAGFKLKEMLERSADVAEVAALTRKACECRLPDSTFNAIKKLQSLASESESFTSVAGAARELSYLVQYGSIRKYDTGSITPLMSQLFIKAALLIMPCASVNDEEASKMAEQLQQLHYMTQEMPEHVNDELWLKQLKDLAYADDKNAILCGFALSLLLERGQAEENRVHIELSRRMSPGNAPEASAGWFEGLSKRNRAILLSRIFIWEQLDNYMQSLDDDSFKRTVVCLRRAFSNFSPAEKVGICEILADIWQVDANSASELLTQALSAEEDGSLGDLNDFDFGDF